MSLQVNVSSDTGTVTVALVGAAEAAMLAPLDAPLRAALTDAQLLILDLSDVSALDADGLRTVLLGLLEDTRGGELRIAANHPEVLTALAGARIHHLVAVHKTVAEATSIRDETVR